MYVFEARISSASEFIDSSDPSRANMLALDVSFPPDENTRLIVAMYPTNASSAPSTASSSAAVRSSSVSYSGMSTSAGSAAAPSPGCSGRVEVGAATGGAVGASCQGHECQCSEKGDNDQGRSTKRSGRSSFHSTPLWSATAVRASAGTRSPYIIRPEGVLEQAKSNLWITHAEVS